MNDPSDPVTDFFKWLGSAMVGVLFTTVFYIAMMLFGGD